MLTGTPAAVVTCSVEVAAPAPPGDGVLVVPARGGAWVAGDIGGRAVRTGRVGDGVESSAGAGDDTAVPAGEGVTRAVGEGITVGGSVEVGTGLAVIVGPAAGVAIPTPGGRGVAVEVTGAPVGGSSGVPVGAGDGVPGGAKRGVGNGVEVGPGRAVAVGARVPAWSVGVKAGRGLRVAVPVDKVLGCGVAVGDSGGVEEPGGASSAPRVVKEMLWSLVFQ